MSERDARTLRVVACLLVGRLAAATGLLACLLHVLLRRPPLLWRAAAGTAVGVALLAEAASLLDDSRIFADELVRAVGLAALFLFAAVGRLYFVRVPHSADVRERAAALACAAGFGGCVLWLKRSARRGAPREEPHHGQA